MRKEWERERQRVRERGIHKRYYKDRVVEMEIRYYLHFLSLSISSCSSQLLEHSMQLIFESLSEVIFLEGIFQSNLAFIPIQASCVSRTLVPLIILHRFQALQLPTLTPPYEKGVRCLLSSIQRTFNQLSIVASPSQGESRS